RERERRSEGGRDGGRRVSTRSGQSGPLKGPAAGCTTATCGWRALLLPQLNRQSLYVYGSEMAVEQECRRQLQSGVFVIHPFSLMRYFINVTDSGQPLRRRRRHFLVSPGLSERKLRMLSASFCPSASPRCPGLRASSCCF
uniref:Ion transport N-terminal domain-containing protein n=1 Tax=Cyclopterus lumpus TaxID=8103 RepID=A0A8C2ZTQ4_CYCLU